MKYNFDEVLNLSKSSSLKYDFAKEMGVPESALPLWEADMDFRIPTEATEALLNKAKHSVFGYMILDDDYRNAVLNWCSSRYGFNAKPEWIVTTPGGLCALAMAVRSFTQEHEAILIQGPVFYYMFANIISGNKRKIIDNSLVYKNGRYHIDLDDFERKVVENNVKMFILCNPHNPVGRVWTKDELYEMGQICLRNNCLVVSDEIHCDIVYEGYKHHNFTTVHESFLENTLVITSPSKAFNLAGMQTTNVFVANEKLRIKYTAEISNSGLGSLNTMGQTACKAVYEHGREWLSELLQYLKGNLEYMKNYFAEHFPQVKVVEPEGTYLIWLDFTALNLPQNKLDRILFDKADVWLSSGVTFGHQGSGFQRITIACPRKTLEAGLQRICKIKPYLGIFVFQILCSVLGVCFL